MQVNFCLPFLFGTKVTSRVPDRLEMTVVVRGVFRLAPGEPVAPIGDVAQLGLQGDIFADGDDERTGALRHASDFADFKLKTDLLLRGTCYPGRAARVCTARFGVGDWSKSVRVFGRRVWKDGILDPVSDPIPFESMPITYENAFGGPEFARNPAGKGCETVELPTVENPAALVTSRRDRPEPAGFGPLSPYWPQRSKKMGKDYGGSWKKTRAPFYSEDFDWSHFNSAPEDQQRPGYLKGDEALVFEFLHPKATRFSAALPGVRPRVFVRRTDGFTAEVSMHLDTLIADLDGERLVLLWRGLVEVDDDQLDDVRTLFIGCEPLTEPRSAEHYLAELEALDRDPVAYMKDKLIPPEAKRQIEEGKLAVSAVEAMTAEAQAKAAEADAKAAAIEAKAAEAEAKAAEKTPELPKDPAGRIAALLGPLGKDQTPEQAKAQAELIEKLKTSIPSNEQQLPELKEQARGALTPTRGGIHEASTKSLGTSKARVASKGMSVERFEVAEAQLAQAQKQQLAADAALEAKGLPNQRALADAAALGDGGVPDAAGAEVPAPEELAPPISAEAPGRGANLMERDLSGWDLQGADLRGALLRKARLVGTKLAGANLAGADLGEAHLEGADLSGADLTGTNLCGARAPRAVFDKATLVRTLFAEADLTGASLVGARGAMVVFQGAALTGAKFLDVRFHKAYFGKGNGSGNLDAADFEGAELDVCLFLQVSATDAHFDETTLTKTAFLFSNMPGATYYRASGHGCSWQGTTLDGADFQYASLRRSQLNKASLLGANLHASDFRGGRFERASLAHANFSQADLMSVSFSKAKLGATDFSGASLYDAKFLGSTASEKCNFDGANLTRAMWAQP